MVYLSLSARILFNIEALNMTESVGNFVRHRRAPIVIPTERGYVLKYVPVISGESLAHAYQEILAKLAVEEKLPVCKLCRQGIFLKHSDKQVFRRSGIPEPRDLKDPEAVEEAIVKGCVVEDVGGFLYTDATLKRTSRFIVGYMMPSLDTIKSSAAEAQFHVRYDPLGAEAQAIYNVEAGSALYTLNAGLDIQSIGLSSIKLGEKEPYEIVSGSERLKRIEVALKALGLMITQQLFGAKRTRFMPQWKIMSLVILVSHPLPLNTIPGHDRGYIVETSKTAESAIKMLRTGKLEVKEEAYLIYYNTEDAVEPMLSSKFVQVYKADTPGEAFTKAYDIALKLLTQR